MRALILAAILAAGALAAERTQNSWKLPPDFEARVAALEAARQAHPRDAQTLEALAGSYSMAGQYEKAIRALRELQTVRPGDASLQLRIARNQAWDRKTRLAIESYQIYLLAKSDDRQASIELIRLYRYRGDYAKAEKLCNKLLQSQPDDAVALALKAEVLHWAGNRRRLAQSTAELAVRAAAAYPDAQVAQVYALRDLGETGKAREEFNRLRDQVARRGGPAPESTYGDAYRLLEGELAHPTHLTSTPAYSVYNDADGIHNDFWNLRLAAPLRSDHTLLLDVTHNRSSAPLASPFADARDTASISEFKAGGTFRAAPAVFFTVLGGGLLRNTAQSAQAVFDFRVAAAPIDRWTFDFSAGREFLAVTPRAIDRDVSSYKVAGGVEYAFDARTSLAARADRRYWSDDNRSIAGEATLRRILHYYKPFMVDGGVLSHWEHFDRDTKFASGFFTPEQYRRHDGFLGLHGELGRRLSYDLRGAAGAQRISSGADYRADWEATASAGIKLSRSLRLWLNYQRRNYTLVSRNGWYQGFYFSLGVQQ